MRKRLAIKGHPTRGKEVIEQLEMMGGKNTYEYNGRYFIDEIVYTREVAYYIDFESEIRCIDIENITTYFIVYSLEMFLKTFPFKVGDKVFLYDNITEGCVTGMEWDENKGTVKYCVYTSAEYWCDVKELLKWNPIDFLEDKHCNEKQVNGMKNVLTELLYHIKNTPKEELEREFEEIKEWSNVGPTVEEFITFCECVNKKPKYPTTYVECCEVIANSKLYAMNEEYTDVNKLLQTLQTILICRNAYWKIAGEEMGLGKPWEPKFGKYIHYSINFYLYQDSFVLHKGEYSSSDNRILVFPTEEMRDAFYENFKDLIGQCKELL